LILYTFVRDAGNYLIPGVFFYFKTTLAYSTTQTIIARQQRLIVKPQNIFARTQKSFAHPQIKNAVTQTGIADNNAVK
jgi:hypothetical protein